MEDRYEIEVFFSIEDFDFDPDIITLKTGIEPNNISRAGEPVSWANKIKPGRHIPKVKFNLWEVRSSLPLMSDLEEQMLELIQRLKPSWHKFIELSTQYSGMFTCIIWDYNDARPAIYFDRNLVKEIAELNAGFQVSVYKVYEK